MRCQTWSCILLSHNSCLLMRSWKGKKNNETKRSWPHINSELMVTERLMRRGIQYLHDIIRERQRIPRPYLFSGPKLPSKEKITNNIAVWDHKKNLSFHPARLYLLSYFLLCCAQVMKRLEDSSLPRANDPCWRSRKNTNNERKIPPAWGPKRVYKNNRRIACRLGP